MAEIRVENLQKAFGEFVAVREFELHRRRRRVLRHARPVGLRQDDDAAHDRRARTADLGPHPARRRGRHLQAAPRERDIAFVFQLFALYPHMNVRKNIGFPLKCQGMPAAEIRPAGRGDGAASCASTTSSTSRCRGLAGGDRQRVALGRAIVRRPMAFLMDEPLGTLDTEFRDLMVRELRELHHRIKATTVYVTHDQLEAMAMADKIAVMNHGVIEQFGTPQEIYDRPATMFVADFIGSPPMNFLPFRAGLQKGASERARSTAPRSPCRSVAEDVADGRAGARRPARAHPLRRCTRGSAARCSAPSISAPRRSSRSTPSTARSRRACPPTCRPGRARPSASRSVAERLSLFDKAPAAPSAPRCTRERRHG